jgi:hypothetical protein
MKRGLILLTGLFLLSSSAWSAGTLKVTMPNGGNKWKTSKSYPIRWNKGSAGKYVRIRLLKSGRHYRWITKKTSNDGRYVWKIPTSVVASNNYKIRIQPYGKSGYDNSDRSFSIAKGALIVLGNNNAELTGKPIGKNTDKNLWKKVPVMLDGKRAATAYIGRSSADSQTIYWSILVTNSVLRKSRYCLLSLDNIAFYDSSGKLLVVDSVSYLNGSVGRWGSSSMYTDTCLASGESGIFAGIEIEDSLYDDVAKVVVGQVDGYSNMKSAPLRVIPLSYQTSGSYKEPFVKIKNLRATKTKVGSVKAYLLNKNGKPIYWDIGYVSKDLSKKQTYDFAMGFYYDGSASSVRVFLDLEPTSSSSSLRTNRSCTGPKEKKLKCLKDASDDRNAQMEKRLTQQRGTFKKVNLNWILGQ